MLLVFIVRRTSIVRLDKRRKGVHVRRKRSSTIPAALRVHKHILLPSHEDEGITRVAQYQGWSDTLVIREACRKYVATMDQIMKNDQAYQRRLQEQEHVQEQEEKELQLV